MVAAPILNEWLEKFPAGVPDRCRTALRCFWNQKRVAGRLESSVKRGSDGSLDCDFLRWGKARRVWYGDRGDWSLKM